MTTHTLSFRDRAFATVDTAVTTFCSAVKTAEVDVKIINLATKILELLKTIGTLAPNAGIAFLIHAEPFSKVGELFNSLPGTFGALKRSDEHDGWFAWVCNKSFAIVDVISVNSFLDDMGVPSLSLIVDRLGELPVIGQFVCYLEELPIVGSLLFFGNTAGVIDNAAHRSEKRKQEELYSLVRDRWARKLQSLDASPADTEGAKKAEEADAQKINSLIGHHEKESAEIAKVTGAWDQVFGLPNESSIKIGAEDKKAHCREQIKRWTVLANEAWKSRADGDATILVNTSRVALMALKFFAIGAGAPILLCGVVVASMSLGKTIAFKHYWNSSHEGFKMPKTPPPVIIAA